MTSAPDPRQADVAAARALLDQASRDGAVQLPAMSAAELCTLGAMQASLIDEDAWNWWTGKAEAEREALSSATLKFLTHRKLLDPPDPASEGPAAENVALRVRPDLGVILAGRTRPAFIVLSREGAEGTPRDMRLYGIADEEYGLRAVLAEEATHRNAEWMGPAYLYLLASPAEAAMSLVRWINRPAGRTLRRRPPKVVDVYRANVGDGPARDHIEVTREGPAGYRVTRTRAGQPAEPPADCDETGLHRLLTAVMTDGSR